MSKGTIVEAAVEGAESLAGALKEGTVASTAAEHLRESAYVERTFKAGTNGSDSAGLISSAAERVEKSLVDGINNLRLGKLIGRAEETNSDAVVITKDGKLVGEWYFGVERQPREVNSITKSMTNLAVGKLHGAGKLSLDEPVSTFYTEWMAGPKQDVTVRHLLNHTSGLPFSGEARGVEGALAAELVADPGAEFRYSNAGVDVLSGIVESVSGKRLDRYVADEIFTPLGIKDFTWLLDKEGHALGAAGLHAQASDIAKIGELMSNNGSWNGAQIIRPEWIAESTKPATALRLDSGLLWWLEGARFKTEANRLNQFVGADGFSARGYNGQFLTVYPKEKLVGVRMIRNDKHATGADDFNDFAKLLKRLPSDS